MYLYIYFGHFTLVVVLDSENLKTNLSARSRNSRGIQGSHVTQLLFDSGKSLRFMVRTIPKSQYMLSSCRPSVSHGSVQRLFSEMRKSLPAKCHNLSNLHHGKVDSHKAPCSMPDTHGLTCFCSCAHPLMSYASYTSTRWNLDCDVWAARKPSTSIHT